MAARFWALGLVLELTLAVCTAWLLVWGAGAPVAAAVAAGLALPCVLPVAAVIASLTLARGSMPGDGHGGRGTSPLGLIAREALALEGAMARMAAQPVCGGIGASAASVPKAQPTLPPVLLVHGLACNGALWRPLLARLERAGAGASRAVSLEPLFGELDAYSSGLLAPLEALWLAGGRRPVAIVAHSMGGLLARALLRRAAAGRIAAIVTIGTPHHGTLLACRFRWPCAQQMCPGSPWLRELNGEQEGRLTVPVSSIYSVDDNLICPPESAVLAGARLTELRGLGHLGLASSPRVLDRVLAELARC